MMLGSAVAAGIDCHGSAAASSDSQGTRDHQSLDEDQHSKKAPEKLHLASNCPLATLTGITAPGTDLALELDGTAIKQAEPPVLVETLADLVDPPPRAVS